KDLGQPMIVENKAGAGTSIGAAYVARENPDGYTLLMATNSTLVTNRYLYKELPYDPDSFVPIGMVGIGPLVLLASPKHGFKSTQDIVAYAKQHPGKLTFATFGAGTSSHLAAELFKKPSGFSRATYAAPIEVPAPALFSTIMGWPRSLAMRSVSRRVRTSVAPPAGKGETTLIGRAGKDWAETLAAASDRLRAASSCKPLRSMNFPLCVWVGMQV
ncbi:tripartite tricarboxylate transporter family receptor domain protein, partial [Bordetella pertussis H897]